MKRPLVTIILISAHSVSRADFDGPIHTVKTAPRPAVATLPDAVRMALALGGRTARETWILSPELWTQTVSLSPGQIAGLAPDELARALAFEVEPFSGIAAGDSATGFRDNGGGSFAVVQMLRTERDAIERAVASAGGRLSGIAHPGVVPDDEGAWWPDAPSRIADMAVIGPPPPSPSPRRFLIAGLVFEAAALLLLLAIGGWNLAQRKGYENRYSEFASVAREVDSASKQMEALRKELATLDNREKQQEQINSRRNALAMLLKGLADAHTDDLVVRGMDAEGASTVLVSGFSLGAGAVDELSTVLSQTLKSAGWTAQTRSKKGLGRMADGGPWEFTVTVTHEEAARARALQLQQRSSE
jgi:hypothetical protein